MSNESEAETGNTPPDPSHPQGAQREATVSPKKSLDAFLPSILRPVEPKEPEPKEPEPEKPEVAPGESDSEKPVDGSPAAGAPAKGAKPADGPYRRETKLPVNPRRVRGGVRMKRKEGSPESWAEQRFWRVAENTADGETLKEGLEYARGGQTRRVLYDDGKADASVQGRRTRAYTTIVTMPKYTPDQKAEVARAR